MATMVKFAIWPAPLDVDAGCVVMPGVTRTTAGLLAVLPYTVDATHQYATPSLAAAPDHRDKQGQHMAVGCTGRHQERESYELFRVEHGSSRACTHLEQP